MERMLIREASAADAPAIADLVNRAYRVEAFFVAGNRTDAADVRALMERGAFLLAGPGADGLAGCVYVTTDRAHGYFGMLAVEPDGQGRGTGRALIDACEARARDAGCRVMRIKVVDLRADLLSFYDRLGYLVTGTEPYVHRPVLQRCHFVTMEKALGSLAPEGLDRIER
jgi:ribosomal protein S18 acetylase RimI-like enzyme